MSDPALWHRLQFAFTITYHYLFPQLTMGLAWFLVYWKWRALKTGDEESAEAARFWARGNADESIERSMRAQMENRPLKDLE